VTLRVSVGAVLEQLAARGVAIPPGRVRLDGYGDSEALSEELLWLIRCGRKRAGTSLLWAMEVDGEELPRVGDVEIVLNFRDEPVLVTRIVHTRILPYAEVTAEYAAIEGEGDGSLAQWREAHWAFFGRECARIGRAPTEDMPVVCNVFELIAEVPPPTTSPHVASTLSRTTPEIR
jgi:uncharacterized protein YhfF